MAGVCLRTEGGEAEGMHWAGGDRTGGGEGEGGAGGRKTMII